MLLYLASIVLTALIEIGIILIVSGNRYSRMHEILDSERQTVGLILILVGFGLVPIVNLFGAFVLLILWGFDEL